jgi:hypothetical protein
MGKKFIGDPTVDERMIDESNKIDSVAKAIAFRKLLEKDRRNLNFESVEKINSNLTLNGQYKIQDGKYQDGRLLQVFLLVLIHLMCQIVDGQWLADNKLNFQ